MNIRYIVELDEEERMQAVARIDRCGQGAGTNRRPPGDRCTALPQAPIEMATARGLQLPLGAGCGGAGEFQARDLRRDPGRAARKPPQGPGVLAVRQAPEADRGVPGRRGHRLPVPRRADSRRGAGRAHRGVPGRAGRRLPDLAQGGNRAVYDNAFASARIESSARQSSPVSNRQYRPRCSGRDSRTSR